MVAQVVTTPIVLINDPVRTLMQRIEDERKEAAPSKFRWEDVRTYRDYARGRQRDTLSQEQRRMLRGVHSHRRVDNVSNKVVFEMANRLQFLRWIVADDAVTAYLDDLWVKCKLPKLSGETHYAAVRDGNHAIGLNWSQSQIRTTLHRLRWWDGKTGVYVAYDEGEPAYAVNEWQESGLTRRTLYYPDRIERFIAQGDGWRILQLPGDESWPVPWVKRDGSPLHIPIVHFAAGSDDDTPYGASTLDGGVLGLQDDINDVQSDVTVAARMTAYQMYFGTGVKPATDAAGEPAATEVGPGVFLENENENARYGSIPAGDMSQLLSARSVKIEAVAVNTGTPMHLIKGGDWPSGEALLRAEMPLVNRAMTLTDSFKPDWATVGHRSTEMANTFGTGPELDENVLIDAEFAPPERRDELTLRQIEHERVNVAIAKLEIGFSVAQVLRDDFGLNDDQISKMEAERQHEMEIAGLTTSFGAPGSGDANQG